MDEGATRTERVTILRRNRWRLLAMAWPLFFSFLGLLMLAVGATSYATFVVIGLVLAAASLSAAWDENVDPRREPARLTIRESQLSIGDDRYDLGAIRSGYVLAGDPPRIRLFVGEERLPIDVEHASREAAEATLEALELSPRQRIATFRTFASPHGWRGAALTFVPIALFVYLYLHYQLIGIWIVPLLLLWAYVTRFWRRKVHVGSDGLRIERGILFDRFVPHDAISGVHLIRTAQNGEVHVAIQVAEGREARVGFRSEREADAFMARIEEASRAARRDDVPTARALARGDADSLEWVVRLRAAAQVGAHRTAALAQEQLWSLLEAASVEPWQRAAAAVALGRDLDAPTRKRIADVAAATASPRLRVVLERVATEAEDEAVAEALAELDERDSVARG